MIKFLIEKEFKQIIRDTFLPKMIIFMPMLMILIFPWAANQDVRDIKLSVVDSDHSTLSERLVDKITSSGHFNLTNVSSSNNEALQSIELGESDIIFEIQSGFEQDLFREGAGEVMISANAVNSTRGAIGSSYLSYILSDFSSELQEEYSPMARGSVLMPLITLSTQNRFNPHLDYKVFMVPAIMVILLTLIAGFLPALNIVAEKEKGTIEQMNVTPVNKFIFILSKLIPYWIICFIVLSICFGLSALAYGLVPVGSLTTIYLYASIYILVVSGLGLVVSNHSATMQQAMFVMFFFIMIFILMSGLFTPVSSMPDWAQILASINPLKYFIQVMRMIYLKGSGMGEMLPQLFTLLGFALVFNLWAVLSYRKSR